MATNQIGIKNSNIIVPYTANTKQSKILDISSYVTGTGWTSANSVAKFHADSSGNWWIDLSITGSFSAGATSKVVSVAGITFKNGTNNWALSVLAGGSAPYTGSAEASRNSNTIGLYATTSATLFEISGSAPLASEPTWASLGTTAAAALEGALPVDVYIPPASAGIAGLVNNVVGNTAGTPILGKTDGVAVTSGYVGQIIAGSISSTVTGITATGQYADGSITLGLGTYLVPFSMYQVTGSSDTTVETVFNLKASAGSATVTTMIKAAGLIRPSDGSANGVVMGAVGMCHVVVTSSATIKAECTTLLGGTLYTANLDAIQAIRIA